MTEPMPTPDPAALIYARRRDISFQDFGGDGLLVVPRQSLQIVLNGTSLRLLQLVDGRRTVSDIAAAFAEEYDAPPTETLEAARKVAQDEGLSHVYIGNVAGSGGENTICPGCGKTVVRRVGYTVDPPRLTDGACTACGRAIAGVWK